jgi:3-oxoacyl-[acyl-carrier protein] reductase
MSTQSLKGKKAMVIGGSRGIGAAVVKRLAREGAAVAFTYVSSRAPAEALATSIEDAGGHATALHADSADAKALDVAVDRAAEALGGLDVLVNNAGILIHGNVADYSLADFDKMIAVNVRGVFVAAKAALVICLPVAR